MGPVVRSLEYGARNRDPTELDWADQFDCRGVGAERRMELDSRSIVIVVFASDIDGLER